VPVTAGEVEAAARGQDEGVAGRRAIGVVVFTASAVLLLSMGGAVVAAPVTVPLMVVTARRRPTPAFRGTAAVLVALTVGEVAWALTYVTAGEAPPWIWLVPLVACAAAGVAVVRTATPAASDARDGP
jgi:hypothetical protein